MLCTVELGGQKLPLEAGPVLGPAGIRLPLVASVEKAELQWYQPVAAGSQNLRVVPDVGS